MGQSVEHSKDSQGSSGWIPSFDVPITKEEAAHIPVKLNDLHVPSDTSLFSSSLTLLFHGKLNLSDRECNGKSKESTSFHTNQPHDREDPLETLQDMESHAQGYALPDDEEELLAGVMDDFDLSGLPSQVEELEEYDLFSSGGGMELDSDPQESLNLSYSNALSSEYISGGSTGHYGISNVPGPVVGEHPYGEHPSRTLFVRNINSNVEDSELRQLFEQYGDIRMLYTATKHRGFVMISYYDIRSARVAMRALQNKPLRRRKLDIHFSIPKDNPSDKDINQGTLVAFNLDPSVSNDELRQIFGAYGEVKEIRETPHKRHHKFIEFYDVRAAEAALRGLNRSDINGKRIKLEPSRPGGARRSFMQHVSQEAEQDESRTFQQQVGSPVMNSPPGPWEHLNNSSESGSLQGITYSRNFGNINHSINKSVSAIGASLPPFPSSKTGIVSSDFGRAKQIEQVSTINSFGKPGQLNQSHSFPDYESGMLQVMHYNSSGSVPVPRSSTTPFGHHEGIASGSGGSFGHPSPSSVGSGNLSGHQYLWRSPSPYSHHIPWPAPPHGHSFNASGSHPYPARQIPYMSSGMVSHHHHVGSAPSGEPTLERHYGYLAESPDLSFVSPSSLGAMNCTSGSPVIGFRPHAVLNAGATAIATNGSTECGSPIGVLSPQRKGRMFPGAGLTGSITNFVEGLNDRGRSRRGDNTTSQADNKKQYQLDLEKIMRGEDARTTIMIKNIPNKYTSKMLLSAIDEHHRGTYDFLYLPIDFKNKCNVGYAFINMTAPSHIIPFYQAFNGKKWEKFNSEKVASLAYARIQGKNALIAHFQNSSLMNEDKRCRPIVFNPEGGDQEILPMGLDLKVHPMENSGDGESRQSTMETTNDDNSVRKADKTTTDNDFNEISSELNKLLDLS